jgi:Holliday junction resolvase RusA-like endonuclease
LNSYWKNWRGHIVVSPEGKRYKQGVKLRALTEQVFPTTEPVAITVTVFRKAARGDADNFLKCLLDSLQGVAYVNDSQIRELHVFLQEDPSDPRVIVWVDPLVITTSKPVKKRKVAK